MNEVKRPSKLGAAFTIAFWLAIAAGTVYTLFFASHSGRVNQGIVLRNYQMVGAFSLTDQQGNQVKRSDLEGKIWVASFFFTSCNTQCVVVSARMADLQNRFAKNPDVAFVSISVDPQTDTPQRLEKYAERYGAGPNWSFLTGDSRKVDELIKGSFLLPVARDDGERSQINQANLIHSDRIAVVDRLGVVRFYVDGMTPEAVDLVSKAVEMLLTEKR